MPSVFQTLQTALTMHQSGQLEQAERLYRDVVRHDPAHSDALHLLGVAAHQQRRHHAAVEFIKRAIDVKSSAVYYSNLGAAYRALGERENAVRSLRSAVRIDNRFADAYYNLGTLLKECGQRGDAIDSLRRALEIQPKFPDAWNNLGILLNEQHEYIEAIGCFRKAIEFNPQLAPAHNNLGTALSALGRFDEAVRSYRQALDLDPQYADAHCNLGNVHRELDRLEEAEAAYRQTLQIDARHVAAYVNLGLVHQERSELEAAVECSSRAIELDPNHVEAHINRSFVRRLQGNLRESFAEFEWRWKEENIAPRFGGPLWDGSPLKGKTILVYAEQGVGDEIMFASCVPDVARQAARCILECDRRLVSLFERSFPRVTCVSRWDGKSLGLMPETPSYDVRIAAGSLLQFLRPAAASFPRHRGYLVPSAAAKAKWASRYRQLGNGPRIGISWRGGKRTQTRRKRTTGPQDWAPILAVPGVHFVNLQYGDCRADLELFQETTGVVVHHWDDANPLSDLDNFAAQIAALDLVISIDNSTVHMAGALGVAVWNMIPFSPDWRWQMYTQDTFWYPSMKLFRQSTRGDWDSVFESVARRLLELTQGAPGATGVSSLTTREVNS